MSSYVDSIIELDGDKEKKETKELKARLRREFEMKDFGELKKILDTRIRMDERKEQSVYL